jgi:UDP-N-acetylmuramyl pentapeptide phosphotransferase/UDP-N-acetylglucosamine-1-phosphate transferase
MSSQSKLWPTIIIVTVVVLGVLVFGNITSPIRTALALWFLVVCPGMALVGLLRLNDPWAEVALGTTLSLSLDVLLSLCLVYSGFWSPNLGLVILMVISLVGVALQLRRDHSLRSVLVASPRRTARRY